MSSWRRRGLKLLVGVLALGAAACGSSRNHGHHAAHHHQYRHGYYNPVDGYFHDDHWHHQARHKHHRGCGHAVSYNYY